LPRRRARHLAKTRVARSARLGTRLRRHRREETAARGTSTTPPEAVNRRQTEGHDMNELWSRSVATAWSAGAHRRRATAPPRPPRRSCSSSARHDRGRPGPAADVRKSVRICHWQIPNTSPGPRRGGSKDEKTPLSGAFRMRPSGLEPPRRNLSTRPSTPYSPARCSQERPNRPNSAVSRTHRTHMEQRVLPRCCHAMAGISARGGSAVEAAFTLRSEAVSSRQPRAASAHDCSLDLE
jgi:hypothetical protein